MAIGHVAGATYAQFWRVDQYGRMCGTQSSPDSIANNTTTSARRLRGMTGFDMADAERSRVDFRDADGVVGSLYFASDSAPTGNMTVETVDSILRNMAEGGNTDTTTISGWTIWGSNNMKPNANNLGCCITRRYQSRDSGTDGDALWLNEIYLLQLSMKDPQAAYQDKSTAQIGVTAIAQGRFPNGVAFGANQGFYDNKTYAIKLLTDNPISFTTYIANGTATEFTLPYLPSSSVVTAATKPNYMAINNTEVAPSAVSTSTGVVTLAAAGSAADFVSIIYETEFTASS